MFLRLLSILAVFGSLVVAGGAAPANAARPSAADCEFVLGFKAIHDAIPSIVGECLVSEHHNPANGDGLQETTAWHGKGGLLVWRKADNWTAFTDGSITWINGPMGLQSRPNQGPLFTWESPSGVTPASPANTPTPVVATSTPLACVLQPGPLVGKVLQANPSLAARLGCAQGGEASVQLAWQSFQGGHLLWRADTNVIYALRQGGAWQALSGSYQENEYLTPVVAPRGLYVPERGFGKVWRAEPGLRDALGWATIPERGLTGNFQDFANGRVIYVLYDKWAGSPAHTVYVLYSDNASWTRFEDESAR